MIVEFIPELHYCGGTVSVGKFDNNLSGLLDSAAIGIVLIEVKGFQHCGQLDIWQLRQQVSRQFTTV